MISTQANPVGIDALRSDGGLIHIRPVVPGDRDELVALDERVSLRSIYLRFFSGSRHTADVYLPALLEPPSPDHRALVATVGETIVAVAAYDRLDDSSAELGLLVDDSRHHEGIGTLLVEHLAALARIDGLRKLDAVVLAENHGMIKLITSLGFAASRTHEYDTITFILDIDAGDAARDAVHRRDRISEVASMRAILAPRSVAVIGAGVRPNSAGHEILRNILQGGFTGELYAVNPRHENVLGVICVPTARDLPVAPDLAIVVVPAAHVHDVVVDCGERGARAIVLVTAGFSELGADGQERQAAVLTAARKYGMRLVGPNCLGVVNTDPAVRLQATFARPVTTPGSFSLVSQSGALGVAVIAAAERRGIGVSQFVSVGNKADVSSNDLLLAWDQDPRTEVIGLYLESFGNPRRFARIARAVSASKPIIAIKAGRSVAGQRAGQSHTAAAAASETVVDALFDEAGVLRVDGMPQLLDVVAVMTGQPAMRGPRVAVVGNSGDRKSWLPTRSPRPV